MKYAPLLLLLFGSEILSLVVILVYAFAFIVKILKERADHADY